MTFRTYSELLDRLSIALGAPKSAIEGLTLLEAMRTLQVIKASERHGWKWREP